MESIRIFEDYKDGEYIHSISINDCGYFRATATEQADAIRISVEKLRQFVADVIENKSQMESRHEITYYNTDERIISLV